MNRDILQAAPEELPVSPDQVTVTAVSTAGGAPIPNGQYRFPQ